MRSSHNSSSIDRDLENFKIDPHWDDETIIDIYKKKVREICSKLEKEEKLKKKELLLSTNSNNFILKNVRLIKSQNIKRPNSAAKLLPSTKKSKLFNDKKESEKIPINPKVEEQESVLNMLFPYVNENEFQIEPFKSGADLRKETLEKKKHIPVIKVNMERRLKSNFIEKYKQYDKYLNTYAKNPSIRCSSAYITEDQKRRQDFIKSKKLWVTTDDFRRFFGNKGHYKANDINKKEKYIPNKYVEPHLANCYRIIDKNKWMSTKNFII